MITFRLSQDPKILNSEFCGRITTLDLIAYFDNFIREKVTEEKFVEIIEFVNVQLISLTYSEIRELIPLSVLWKNIGYRASIFLSNSDESDLMASLLVPLYDKLEFPIVGSSTREEAEQSVFALLEGRELKYSANGGS